MLACKTELQRIECQQSGTRSQTGFVNCETSAVAVALDSGNLYLVSADWCNTCRSWCWRPPTFPGTLMRPSGGAWRSASTSPCLAPLNARTSCTSTSRSCSDMSSATEPYGMVCCAMLGCALGQCGVVWCGMVWYGRDSADSHSVTWGINLCRADQNCGQLSVQLHLRIILGLHCASSSKETLQGL